MLDAVDDGVVGRAAPSREGRCVGAWFCNEAVPPLAVVARRFMWPRDPTLAMLATAADVAERLPLLPSEHAHHMHEAHAAGNANTNGGGVSKCSSRASKRL